MKLNHPLFIPFTVLGDPNIEQSFETVRVLIDNGADMLELGLPFSDPPADGSIIQAADQRALSAGVCIDDCFVLLERIRAYSPIPIGLLIYYNLIYTRGIEKFFRDCAAVPVNSVLIADLPFEHADEVLAVAQKYDIALVFIVNELTTSERLKEIAAKAKSYLYIVSYLGVTGVENAVLEEKIRTTINRARQHTNIPLFVGFGINTPEHVYAAVNAGADGVIVGSRIVKQIPDLNSIKAICRELSRAALFP